MKRKQLNLFDIYFITVLYLITISIKLFIVIDTFAELPNATILP